ncbi:hypothetical protein [Gordonia malaquae]|uniref:hypothetical protein n=1 Tax=Gordonia malaquae TaxID=410332 RepID=UPI0030FE9D0D
MPSRIQAEMFVKEFESLATKLRREIDNPQVHPRRRTELTNELDDIVTRIDHLRREFDLP